MEDIQEFVMRGGQRLTASAIFQFREKLPFIGVKATELAGVVEYPHLSSQVAFLGRFVEDVLDEAHAPQDVMAVPEGIFALSYLLKDVDIIPDSLPGQGYADDSAVVRAVLRAHREEFDRYAATSGNSLPGLEP